VRNAFCKALMDLHGRRSFVFFTGDLGFMALEPLQAAMGERFINAGVAEQNMVSVAAGVASGREQCWVYSIAPFIYARPFEQIRNDVCLHDFDVKLVGNGGGYGYGAMGPTHHAIEDYGVLLALQNMRVFVPSFADDVPPIVSKMAEMRHPAYLRLGRCEKPESAILPPYEAWRLLVPGGGGIMVIIGPVAGGILERVLQLPEETRPQVWVLSELPLAIAPPPPQLLEGINRLGRLFVVEEHVLQGSVGQMLAHRLTARGICPRTFRHFHAEGYPSGLYGSQAFHRKENGLDADSVLVEFNRSLSSRRAAT
jgi:transketolase